MDTMHNEHPSQTHEPHHTGPKPRPWYKKWWGIILALLFWPIFVIWYAWAKAKWNVVLKVGATALSLIFGAAYATGIANPSQSNPKTTTKPKTVQATRASNSTPNTKSQPKTTSQPKAQEAPKPQTMEDKLWAAVDAAFKTRKNFAVSYDASDSSDKVAYIEHTDPEPFDSQSFIRQSFSILALYGVEVFKIDGVDSVNVQNKTNFIDQYGNKKLDSGVIIDMHKAEYIKFNWKGLDHLPVRQQIQAASDVFIIKPALQPYTDDQLYLTNHL